MMKNMLTRRLSYYKLFPKTFPQGPPPHGKFAIDPKSLRQEYLKLQQQVHPDIAKETGPIDAATISTAYKAMLDPLTRAEHILKLRGIESLGEATLEDEDMLMNIMMIREEAEECEDPQQRKKLYDQNEERVAATVGQLEAAFAKDDLQAAERACVELSYWSKLRKALD